MKKQQREKKTGGKKKVRRIMISLVMTGMCIVSICSRHIVCAVTNENLMTPSGIAYDEIDEAIENYVQDSIGVTTAGANVAVLTRDEILYQQSFGYADIETESLVTEDSMFEWRW